MLHLLQIIEKRMFFLNRKIFYRFFKFSILTTNKVKQFFHLFNYWKYFSIILSFFSQSLGENKFVYSNKLSPFNIKSINPIQKYPDIIEPNAFIV